jgi:hypothetical protein
MEYHVDMHKLVRSINTVLSSYAYENMRVVTYSKIKVESLKDYFIGDFAYFMCWFVNFCSVREEFWPEQYNKKILENVKEYVVEQFEKFSSVKSNIPYRFLCEYIKNISTRTVKCPGKERARSYLREIITQAKRTYSVDYNDSLQKKICEIVKFNLKINDKIWNLPQYIDVNGYYMFVPSNTSEASELSERKRDAKKIITIMNSYINTMKQTLQPMNTIKEMKIKSPVKFKYRNTFKSYCGA